MRAVACFLGVRFVAVASTANLFVLNIKLLRSNFLSAAKVILAEAQDGLS